MARNNIISSSLNLEGIFRFEEVRDKGKVVPLSEAIQKCSPS